MPPASHAAARPAVFLDRDDTLNENATLPPEAFPAAKGDLFVPGFVRLMPGVFDACARLVDAGFVLIGVTNQASVARGSASIRDIEQTNDALRALLTRDGDRLLSAIYAAPHHPDAVVPDLRAEHPWRKPGPGMLLAAARELAIDLAESWLVGDASRDIAAGVAAGLDPERCLRVGPEGDFAGLPDAADFIIESAGSAPPGLSRTAPPILVSAASVVTLRAHSTRPLADAETRRTVEAAAHALAERTGVRLLDLRLDDRSVTATLATNRLAATGFMAELRRSTNTWHASRHAGLLLWPVTPPRSDE